MSKYAALLIALLLSGGSVLAQYDYEPLETIPTHKNERAFSFSLTTNGMGFGGLYRIAMPNYSHLGLNLEFFVVRDDNEIDLIDYFGNAYKLNDLNRLFVIPANVEFKKRLFVDSIEDNFRPHIMIQSGVVFGMNFPKERVVGDQNGSRIIRPANEYRFAYDLLLGFGVDIATRKDVFATIRPQYRFMWFTDEIADKVNHHTFEIKLEIGAN